MEGSARKVITVRSALMVKNRLDVAMEIRLDSPSAPDSESQSTTEYSALNSCSYLLNSLPKTFTTKNGSFDPFEVKMFCSTFWNRFVS